MVENCNITRNSVTYNYIFKKALKITTAPSLVTQVEYHEMANGSHDTSKV